MNEPLSRQSARLDDLPGAGRVVIANPSQEDCASRYAQREGLDYFLSDLTPTHSVYVMDLDLIFAPVDLKGMLSHAL